MLSDSHGSVRLRHHYYFFKIRKRSPNHPLTEALRGALDTGATH